MHPTYPPYIPWLHTPRLRLGVTTVAEDIWVHILLLGVVYPIHRSNKVFGYTERFFMLFFL